MARDAQCEVNETSASYEYILIFRTQRSCSIDVRFLNSINLGTFTGSGSQNLKTLVHCSLHIFLIFRRGTAARAIAGLGFLYSLR